MSSRMIAKQPIAIEWKIAEHKLKELRTSFCRRLTSAAFHIADSDVCYYISIYPNGHNEAHYGETSIFFHLLFKEQPEVEAEFAISIGSESIIRNVNYVFQESKGYGGGYFSVNELFDVERQFIVDGFMVIKLEGYLMIEKDAPVMACELDWTKQKLGMNLWNMDYKDFTIVAEGKEITAHKCVLSSCSPVFQAMFQPHTLEAQENKVLIPDFPFDVVETAIKLCYDYRLIQNIQNIPLEHQMLLLQFYDKYDIQSIKDDFENNLISHITESNVCLLTNCAVTSNSFKLRSRCSDFLRDCLKSTTAVSDLDGLDKDFAYDLLKNSFCKVSF